MGGVLHSVTDNDGNSILFFSGSNGNCDGPWYTALLPTGELGPWLSLQGAFYTQFLPNCGLAFIYDSDGLHMMDAVADTLLKYNPLTNSFTGLSFEDRSSGQITPFVLNPSGILYVSSMNNTLLTNQYSVSQVANDKVWIPYTAPFPPRTGGELHAVDGTLYFAGGYDVSGQQLVDVWPATVASSKGSIEGWKKQMFGIFGSAPCPFTPTATPSSSCTPTSSYTMTSTGTPSATLSYGATPSPTSSPSTQTPAAGGGANVGVIVGATLGSVVLVGLVGWGYTRYRAGLSSGDGYWRQDA